jgi:hypothetical protein
MYFIPSDKLAEIFSFIVIDLHSHDKLIDLIIKGDHEKLKELFNKSLELHKQIIIDVDAETKEMNRLHHAYQNMEEIAKERIFLLDHEREYLRKLEKLLWLNLENFNRLRSQYTNENIRQIFKDNVGEPKQCEECTKLFIASSPRQKFCSVECRRKATSKRSNT